MGCVHAGLWSFCRSNYRDPQVGIYNDPRDMQLLDSHIRDPSLTSLELILAIIIMFTLTSAKPQNYSFGI